MRSEEKRMKGMEGTRVLGSTQPPKLGFLSLILHHISMGTWASCLGLSLGPNWCSKGPKTSKNRIRTFLFIGGAVLQFLEVLGLVL